MSAPIQNPNVACSSQSQANPQRARSGALDGAVAAVPGYDQGIRDVFASSDKLQPARQRPGQKYIDGGRRFQCPRVEVVFELRANPVQGDLGALAATLPACR